LDDESWWEASGNPDEGKPPVRFYEGKRRNSRATVLLSLLHNDAVISCAGVKKP